MSDVLQGAKTRDYVKSDIPGVDGKLIENSGDKLSYMTAQEVPGKRTAMDVLIHGVTVHSSGHTVDAGSVQRRIASTAHGAKAGWFMRPTDGPSAGEEIPITKVIDADSFVIAAPFDLAIGNTFEIVKSVTPNYTEAGDLNVVVTASGPVQFIKDTVITTVEEDTVTPANNEALPTKMFIQKDGVTYPVNKDTVFPSNTISIPVEITSASGPINITAGDLNVQLSDQGPNADVTRVGDGTNQWGMNASKEGLVHDADALAELADINIDTSDIADSVASIDVKTPALVGGKVPVDTGLAQGLTDTELRATPVPVSGTVTANLGTVAGISTEAKQNDQITSFGTRTDTMATDYFGNFSFMALVKRLGLYLNSIDTQMVGKATETTLSALNGKVPSQGQALASASIPVVLPAIQVASMATSARQDLQTASLTSIDGKLAGTLTVTQAAPTVTQTDDTQNTDSITPVAFTKPVGAKNMVIFNNAGASVANRIRFGAAPSFASSGTGALLGVGSSTALLPASAFSVIAENTDSNANVTVIWFY